jgi:3-oxoacyl-[acyl-carrier protein] reductase
MDLGIKGKWAIVCGASKGLGYGCAEALAAEGVNLVINARTTDTLEAAATTLRGYGVTVHAVACDIATEEGRKAVLGAAPQVDILVNNAGGPPPGDFRNFTRDDWLKAIDANMLTPIELIKSTIDPMIARKFGRIVNITSSAVKAPIDILALSNGARSGLTGFSAGLARKVAMHNVTVNNLLPGVFYTDRLKNMFVAQARTANTDVAAAEKSRLNAVPAGRFGEPKEFGQMCAYLCSQQASYYTGQNVLLDGGAYPGTF